jgi:hypothetical protein
VFPEELFNPLTLSLNKAQDENGDIYTGTIADKIQIKPAGVHICFRVYLKIFSRFRYIMRILQQIK